MTGQCVAIVVVSYNAWPHLERCLASVADSGHELIVVDNGSSDGSPQLVRHHFPSVRLLELRSNPGFAAANNEGIALASAPYVLLLNSDAWPVGGAIGRLVAFLDARPDVAAVGPRLRNPDGTLQRSVRAFPTLWRLATEYYFLRKLAPRSRALNAFYVGGFDHNRACRADWLKAAVLLIRREAVEGVGGFDPSFFVFGDEVDLCYRLHQAGWEVVFYPDAEFVHVGGVSTLPYWGRMLRELLRGHMRFFDKHYGTARAEHARKLMLGGLWMRTLVFRGDRRRSYRDAAAWLASAKAADLLRTNG